MPRGNAVNPLVSVPMDVLELLWGRGLCVVWCGAEFGFLGMSGFLPFVLVLSSALVEMR